MVMMEKKAAEMSWLEVAKLVLRESKQEFMSVNEILDVIVQKKLRDMTNCHKPYATLYAVMHNQAKKANSPIVKKLDRISYFACKTSLKRKKPGSSLASNRVTQPMANVGTKKKKEAEKEVESLIVSVDLTRLAHQPSVRKPGGRHEDGVGSRKVNGLRKPIRAKPLEWNAKAPDGMRQRCLSESSGKSSKKLQRGSFKLDLNSPNSLFVHLDIRHLVTKDNFLKLPQCQRLQLLELLPSYERERLQLLDSLPSCEGQNDNDKILESVFCNDYFSAALTEWQTRLLLGELTNEMRARMRHEKAKANAAIPDWKARFYEEVYGERSLPPVPDTRHVSDSTSLPFLSSPCVTTVQMVDIESSSASTDEDPE